jgi:hypothetical protein
VPEPSASASRESPYRPKSDAASCNCRGALEARVCPVPILDRCGGHCNDQHQARGIDQQVTLAPLNMFTGSIALCPRQCRDFDCWLSRQAVAGVYGAPLCAARKRARFRESAARCRRLSTPESSHRRSPEPGSQKSAGDAQPSHVHRGWHLAPVSD